MSAPDRRSGGRLGAALGLTLVTAAAASLLHTVSMWSDDTHPGRGGAPAQPMPAAVKGPSLTILAAGDIIPHPQMWDQARRDGHGALDFGPMLAGAKPAVEAADLALCHLGVPLAPAGGPYADYPRFSVPPEVAKAIRETGYDGCSTAAKDCLDQGAAGVARTLDALDAAGVGHAGTSRSAAEARMPGRYTIKGVQIALLSYTENFNGLEPPAGSEWIANRIVPKKIKQDALAARAGGAQIVVVSLHWGTDYEREPDVKQQKVARKVAAMADVDIVFGHQSHVVQPIEKVRGTWIVYGLGNQIARHEAPVNANREGIMVQATFTPAREPKRWEVRTIEAIPTFVDIDPDIRLVDLNRRLSDPSLPPARRQIYQAALDRIQAHVLTRGAGTDGLIVRSTPAG